MNLLLLLAPIAPHITEELWEKTGHSYSIHNQLMPEWDPDLARDEEITLVVQVNGKLRDRIQVPADISQEDATSLAMRSDKITPYLEGKRIDTVIYVPSRLVNVVVN